MKTRHFRGSITIEASLIAPIVVFVLAAFLNLNYMILTEIKVQKALMEAANHFAVEYIAMEFVGDSLNDYIQKFLYESLGISDDSEENADSEEDEDGADQILSQLQEKIAEEVTDLVEGVAFAALIRTDMLSNLGEDDTLFRSVRLKKYGMIVTCDPGYELSGEDISAEALQVAVYYSWYLTILPGTSYDFTVKQSALQSTWQGRSLAKSDDSSDSEESGQYVYVTKFGSVYHVYADCRYLDIAVHSVAADQIGDERNRSGGRYHACSLCSQDEEASVYYVTYYGDAYHWRSDCTAISHKATKVLLEDTDLEECSVCKEREAQ